MKRLLIILTICISFSSYAQTGIIKGHIYDRIEKQGLAFATVWLLDPKKGTMSDLEGNFKIDSILPGTYKIKISYVGYGDTTYTDIKVINNKTLTVKLELPVACKYEKNKKNNTCPICDRKDKVMPIIYGLPMGELDRGNYFYAGCEITFCDPTWYCKRDKYKF